MSPRKIELDGETLTIQDVISVARDFAKTAIASSSQAKVDTAAKLVNKWSKAGKVIYGVTTGFGPLAGEVISDNQAELAQYNLIISHAAGVGEPLPTEVVRAAMLLRANTLVKGNSGIRLETLETLIALLNKGIHPIIPSKGSVGASGDLAPLSHMVLLLLGEGQAEYQGEILSGSEALKRAGIKPITLGRKEGIALINGTQIMTAIAALAVSDAQNLVTSAEIAAALSIEALEGITDAYDPRIHEVRPHPGQKEVARNLLALLGGSTLARSSDEREKETNQSNQKIHVQDAYSLRCTPQVLGAARDAIDFVSSIVSTEINSATDNPLIFPQDQTFKSGGNFHGQPISLAMDLLAIALTSVGTIAERRIARLIDHNLSNGLPLLLLKPIREERGAHYGLGLAQITAAALSAECQTLSTPASVITIPTSANQEDHVSMGTIAARQTREIVQNVEHIIAIEILCATQGIDFRKQEKDVVLGKGSRIAYDLARKTLPQITQVNDRTHDRLTQDGLVHRDITALWQLVHQGHFAQQVHAKLSDLRP